MNTNIKKGRTNVDFLRTEVSLGERDGEIVVSCVVKLQIENFPIDGLDYIWRKRFPYVSKNGVFKVTGKAVCGDEPFDYEKGMRIAETRAQEKAYVVASKIYMMITEELADITNYFHTLQNNTMSCANISYFHTQDLDVESPIREQK